MDSTLGIVQSADEVTQGTRSGEEFVALFDAHGAVLLATLRRLCGNSHDADDLLQETAVRVWRSFDRRPWLRSPRAWLITIAYRTFLDNRRRDRRREVAQPAEIVDYRTEPPERRAERGEEVLRVNQQLDALSPEIQQVVALHYLGGLSIRQTAAAMDVSIAITKNRLHAALKQLRKALE